MFDFLFLFKTNATIVKIVIQVKSNYFFYDLSV